MQDETFLMEDDLDEVVSPTEGVEDEADEAKDDTLEDEDLEATI